MLHIIGCVPQRRTIARNGIQQRRERPLFVLMGCIKRGVASQAIRCGRVFVVSSCSHNPPRSTPISPGHLPHMYFRVSPSIETNKKHMYVLLNPPL